MLRVGLSLRAKLPTLRQIWFLPTSQRSISGTRGGGLLKVSDEVRDAITTGKPVVALETTIYTHGFPYPENVALASHVESLVRVNGGIPAHIGILKGIPYVGMLAEELTALISTAGSKNTWKVSRRDLGFIAGLGQAGRLLNGGTTIAGTMVLAHLAGIRIFATGGLGGVHRGGEASMDVSADLTELGRTPVTLISSGCKSFLDIPRTLEYLETQGVGVGTFADGRDGSVDFPGFFSRDSGVMSPQVIHDEEEAAAIVHAQSALGLQSGLLFANPVPAVAGLAKEELDEIIQLAVDEAHAQGIIGAANTPYILRRIKELSGNRTVVANRALVESNVIRGTKVALELAKLDLRDKDILKRFDRREIYDLSSAGRNQPVEASDNQTPSQSTASPEKTELLVAGSLAADTLCDYQPIDPRPSSISPSMYTSNPAQTSQSIGGVGHNVALAAHRAGATVSLVSAIADDLAGRSILAQLSSSGLGMTAMQRLSHGSGARTAQYVAFNDTQKDLVMAMADMDILNSPEMQSESFWHKTISAHSPKWIVADANWPPPTLSNLLKAAHSIGIPVAFEPVSTQKSTRLFSPSRQILQPQSVFPNNLIALTTPNALELNAMYIAARNTALFDSEVWWNVINNLNMSSTGSREKLVYITSSDLVDQGVPQQTVQLLPYIPAIITKLGADGCLLTELLGADDEKLTDPVHAPYVLARTMEERKAGGVGGVGGVYMRLFPAAAVVRQEEIVSVNGVGDTLLGIVMAGLVKGMPLEDVLPVAQEGAVLTLKSGSAVSPGVERLRVMLEMRGGI